MDKVDISIIEIPKYNWEVEIFQEVHIYSVNKPNLWKRFWFWVFFGWRWKWIRSED